MAILRQIKKHQNPKKKSTIRSPFSYGQVYDQAHDQAPEKEEFERPEEPIENKPKKKRRKSKAGRKKLPIEERRTQKVVVTMTRSEEARLIRMAKKQSFTKSEFMRRLLDTAIKKDRIKK
tara:strand:- start:205 stop:564 length:360 start_codon:yes stop_codon:yes gene_type:complete